MLCINAPISVTFRSIDDNRAGRALGIVRRSGLVVSVTTLATVIVVDRRRRRHRMTRHSLIKQLATDLDTLVDETNNSHGYARAQHLCSSAMQAATQNRTLKRLTSVINHCQSNIRNIIHFNECNTSDDVRAVTLENVLSG